MTATLNQLLVSVREQRTVIDSMKVYINNLKAQVTNALSGAELNPEAQAKVNAIWDEQVTNSALLAGAMVANT